MITLHNRSNKNMTVNTNANNFWCINMESRVKNILTNTEKELQPNFIILPVPTNIKPDVNLNYNFIISKKSPVFNYKKSSHEILKLLRFKYIWNFKKIRYHGKGYKIRKSNKTHRLNCRFGKSHWTRVIFDENLLNIRRTKKNTYTIISIRSKNLINLKKLILKIKGVSHYTKRGIRLCRQYFKKRFGKVSQANSVYK